MVIIPLIMAKFLFFDFLVQVKSKQVLIVYYIW